MIHVKRLKNDYGGGFDSRRLHQPRLRYQTLTGVYLRQLWLQWCPVVQSKARSGQPLFAYAFALLLCACSKPQPPDCDKHPANPGYQGTALDCKAQLDNNPK